MLNPVFQIIMEEFSYLWKEITMQTGIVNYFWMLTLLSITVAAGEALAPWRRDQPLRRKQFWLDITYMYFNFFIFKILVLSILAFGYEIATKALNLDSLSRFSFIDLSGLSVPIQLILFFVILDFVQWLTHITLHRVPFLWEFHKVHHSVRELSFPAHLRYHWVENIIYTPVKYLTVSLVFGFPPQSVFMVYFATTAIGHLNHANIRITYGPLKYILNNPVMHLWHHTYALPEKHHYGINFGISLSLWDYLFGTAAIPQEKPDLPLGFPGMESFPRRFIGQQLYPFIKQKDHTQSKTKSN